MADLSPPIPTDAVVFNDKMILEFMLWTQDVTKQVNFNTFFDGSGSPEGVLEALPNKLYRDVDVPNLYWKSTGSGDTGWLLVV